MLTGSSLVRTGGAEPRTLNSGLAGLLTGTGSVYTILLCYRMNEAMGSDIHSLNCVCILNILDIFLPVKDLLHFKDSLNTGRRQRPGAKKNDSI